MNTRLTNHKRDSHNGAFRCSVFPFIMQMTEKLSFLSMLQPTRTMNGFASQCLYIFSHQAQGFSIFAVSVIMPPLLQGGQGHGFHLSLITPLQILPLKVPCEKDNRPKEGIAVQPLQSVTHN